MISGGFIKNILSTVISKKQKFKVCKTDLGLDKVYPEGSIVEFDENADWVDELVLSGNLKPVREETERLREEEKLKAEAEAKRLNDEETERLREEDKLKVEIEAEEGKIVVEAKNRNSGRTAKQKDKN